MREYTREATLNMSKGILSFQDVDGKFKNIRVKKVDEPRKSQVAEMEIKNLLIKVGVPAHLKGYNLIKRSVELCFDDRECVESITKVLYPKLAKEYKCSPYSIEKTISYAIEKAWERGKWEVQTEMFGYSVSTTKGKPTNAEFIAMVADKLRRIGPTQNWY